MIQGSINNLLTQVAVFGRLAPGYEKRQEIYDIKKNIKLTHKQFSNIQEGSNIRESKSTRELLPEITAKEEELRKRLFELDPSVKNAKSLKGSKGFHRFILMRSDLENEREEMLYGEEKALFSKARREELMKQRAQESLAVELGRVSESNNLSALSKQLLLNAPSITTTYREKNINYHDDRNSDEYNN